MEKPIVDVSDVLEPVAFSLDVAARVIGISRAKCYQLAKSGQLRVKKVGSRSLTTREYCVDLLESMPDLTGGTA